MIGTLKRPLLVTIALVHMRHAKIKGWVGMLSMKLFALRSFGFRFGV